MKIDKIVRGVICILASIELIIYYKVGILEFLNAEIGEIIAKAIVFVALVVFLAKGISLLLISIIEKKKK